MTQEILVYDLDKYPKGSLITDIMSVIKVGTPVVIHEMNGKGREAPGVIVANNDHSSTAKVSEQLILF